MKIRRSALIGTLSVALALIISIGGTLAFLTDSEEKTNVFTVGDLDITLAEPNWDPDTGLDLEPGSTMVKDPVVTSVKNDSYMRVYMSIMETVKNPAYVDAVTTPDVPQTIDQLITDTDRLALIYQTIYFDSSFDATTPTGEIDTDEKYSLAELAALTTTSNGVNTTSFTKDAARSEAGMDCYNYNGIFTEGTDVILFTNVVIPTDWNQENLAEAGNFKIVLYAQAIQSEGFADADEAFTALDGEVAAGTILKDHATITP